MPIEKFDANKVLRWRSSLQGYLPTKTLVDAIDSCARLAENPYPGINTAYADEIIDDLDGDMEVTLDFPFPGETLDGATWQTFFGFRYTGDSELASLFDTLKLVPMGARASYFNAHIAPVLARRVVSTLAFVADTDSGNKSLPLEATLLTPYSAGGSHYVSVRATGDVKSKGIVRRALKGIWMSSGVESANDVSLIVNSIEVRATTDHLTSKIVSRQDEDLGVPWTAPGGQRTLIRLATPLSAEELVNPEQEDQRSASSLIRHLNDNVEFYHKAIWWLMDPYRRFTLLDGYIAPNSGGRSIASVVENRLVGIIGNCLVLAVAPGIRLDYFEDVSEDAETSEGQHGASDAEQSTDDRLLALYRPLVQIPSSHHAIPTKGVYAESVMGVCNSCEKIDNHRNWQYWQHPLPDEPTSIEPLSLASRATNDVQPTPPMAQPIINQVSNSVPQAPEPTGLSKVLDAVTKSPGFADAMGLAGTQQNARDALAQSYSTTTKFGELAADISKQMNQLAADAVMAYFTGGTSMIGGAAQKAKESIGKDAAAGRITTDQAQRSMAKVNDAVADSLGVSPFRSVLEHPEVAAAVSSAAERGAPLSVEKGDTRVDVGRSLPSLGQDVSSDVGGSSLPWPLRLWFGRGQPNTPTPGSDTDPLAEKLYHHFGSASFTTEVWINNKALFTKPRNVDVEFVTAGPFDWIIADKDGNVVKTLRHKNEHGGWTSINFPSLGLYGNYSIGFRNASSGPQQIKQGDVWLKWP
jgi:hypothetical protein